MSARKPEWIFVAGKRVDMLPKRNTPTCPAVDPDDDRRCALPKGHKGSHKHEEDAS